MTTGPCPDYLALVARSADGSIAPAESERLDEHLRSCDACRAALDAQRDVRAWLVARPALAASPDLFVKVRDALEREARGPLGVDYRRWAWRLAPIAAAVVIAAAWDVSTTANTASTASAYSDVPVTSVLFSGDVSDDSLLSVLLTSSPDATLADYLKEREQ